MVIEITVMNNHPKTAQKNPHIPFGRYHRLNIENILSWSCDGIEFHVNTVAILAWKMWNKIQSEKVKGFRPPLWHHYDITMWQLPDITMWLLPDMTFKLGYICQTELVGAAERSLSYNLRMMMVGFASHLNTCSAYELSEGIWNETWGCLLYVMRRIKRGCGSRNKSDRDLKWLWSVK